MHFFEESGYRSYNLSSLQAPSQAHPELLVESLRLSAIGRGFLSRHADKLQRQVLEVTLERIPAHDEISSVVAKGDLEWVRRQSPYVLSRISGQKRQLNVDLADRPTLSWLA